MKSGTLGRSTSPVEVTNISPHGFWLLMDGRREFFVDFAQFPWFRHAPVHAIANVQLPSAHHLYWPDLDIDLALESIEHPDRYPLVSRADRSEFGTTAIDPLVVALGSTHDEILRFVLFYSRFEYALKRSGFIFAADPHRPSANWKDFADQIQSRGALNAAFRDRAEALLKQAPKKQVLRDGVLRWESLTTGPERTLVERVIDCLRVVRNNLMHGGKYPDAPVSEPGRNSTLLVAGIAAMNALLAVARGSEDAGLQQVAEYFGEHLD